MAIASLDDWFGAVKQAIQYCKTATRVTVANVWFSVFDLAGNPGAGTLAGTSTAAGVVPTDATAGCPLIGFSTGLGYLSGVSYANTFAGRLMVADMLFKAGAYAYNSGTTSLSSQPAYSSRIPNAGAGAGDWAGTQIWIEVSTTFTSATTWAVQVTYTNQAGTTGRTTVTTGSLTAANLTIGKMLQLALQPGDTGVQKIESVIVTTGAAASGAFNVLVLRQLWDGRVNVANGGDVHGFGVTGMPQLWTDSALIVAVNTDASSSGQPELALTIASK